MPMEMSRQQVVAMADNVYIGGTNTASAENYNQVFQYNLARDEWSHLPSCKVIGFAIAQFAGNLITVGGAAVSVAGVLRGVTAGVLRGVTAVVLRGVTTGVLRGVTTGLQQKNIMKGLVTGKVYRFKEQYQKWEEFLKPMPTARGEVSVVTTQSAIVASGGVTDVRDDDQPVPCATVEVYSSETSQWHTADPLPVPCLGMTTVTIADTWYQLGGYGADSKRIHTVLYTPLTALTHKATSPTHQSASHISVWKNLPDTPLVESAAASLSGNLLAVGGWDASTPSSAALYTFLPDTNSWVRVTTGHLPEPRYACTAVQLSSNQVLVVGGRDDQDNRTKTVFLGSITI